MHFSCPLRLYYTATLPFHGRAAASRGGMVILVVGLNNNNINTFQNAFNHNPRLNGHKKNHEKLTIRWEGGQPLRSA